MTRMTATTSPMTVALKAELFEDRWHRQFFIDEWILSDEPDHAMPWEPGEQRPDLGAILVQVDENINSRGLPNRESWPRRCSST